MKSLNELRPGQSATVVGYTSNSNHTRRLKSLGLVPGTTITVERFAPLGDPLQIIFRGYSLGVRSKEVACITVKPH
ncbi:MAG: FeoA family protein [Gammaproteobacteria bacterium]|nr:FeoA family protein [Gammaproteobacteria bacterium]